ncbi:hypothetical protein [Paraburkholderia sp. SIMBA_054]|uniref:hypothetical protein n=1 Tax=Paraburkholderia sp. SIMBA_054 TaxID=3085795 RepID=UPI00397D496D
MEIATSEDSWLARNPWAYSIIAGVLLIVAPLPIMVLTATEPVTGTLGTVVH